MSYTFNLDESPYPKNVGYRETDGRTELVQQVGKRLYVLAAFDETTGHVRLSRRGEQYLARIQFYSVAVPTAKSSCCRRKRRSGARR